MSERLIETPADFAELMKECVARVKYYVELAQNKCGIYMPMPKVLFSLKGTTAGRAYYQQHVIKFQPQLLRENPDEFIRTTAGHEVAHLVAHKINFNCEPHGRDWRIVMLKFCLPPTRCHNYDTSRVYTKVGKVRMPSPIHSLPIGGVKTVAVGRLIELD